MPDQIKMTIVIDTDKAEVSVKGLEKTAVKSLKKIDKESDKTTDNLQGGFKASTVAAGQLMASFAQSAVRSLGRVGKAVADNTLAFRRNAALVENLGAPIQAVTKAIQGFDPVLGKSQDLLEGYFKVFSGGVTETEASLGLLKNAAQLAFAENADLNDVVGAGTKIWNIYGSEIGNTARVFDILSATAQIGDTNLQAIAGSISRVLPASKALGLAIEQTAGTLAILTQVSGSTEQAVTNLNGLLIAIAKSTPEAQEEAEKLGIEWSGAALQAKGFAGFIGDLKDAFEKNNVAVADQAQVLFKLTGRAEAAQALIGLMGESFDKIEPAIRQVSDATGIVTDKFNNMKDAVGPVVALENSINELSIAIGQEAFTTLAPELTKIVQQVTDLTPVMVGLAGPVMSTLADSLNVGTGLLGEFGNAIKRAADEIPFLSDALRGLDKPIDDLNNLIGTALSETFGDISTRYKALAIQQEIFTKNMEAQRKAAATAAGVLDAALNPAFNGLTFEVEEADKALTFFEDVTNKGIKSVEALAVVVPLTAAELAALAKAEKAATAAAKKLKEEQDALMKSMIDIGNAQIEAKWSAIDLQKAWDRDTQTVEQLESAMEAIVPVVGELDLGMKEVSDRAKSFDEKFRQFAAESVKGLIEMRDHLDMLGGLFDQLGLAGAENIKKIANAFDAFAQSAANFATGNVIGGIIGAISGGVSLFQGLFGGGGGETAAEKEARRVENLGKAIERFTGLLDEAISGTQEWDSTLQQAAKNMLALGASTKQLEPFITSINSAIEQQQSAIAAVVQELAEFPAVLDQMSVSLDNMRRSLRGINVDVRGAEKALLTFLLDSQAVFTGTFGESGRPKQFTGGEAFVNIIKSIQEATQGRGFERRISFAEETAILAQTNDKQLQQLIIQTIEARNAKIDRRLSIRAQERSLHNAIVNNATLKHNLPIMRDKLQRLVNLQNQMLETLRLINGNLSRIGGKDDELEDGRRGGGRGRPGEFGFASATPINPTIPVLQRQLPSVTVHVNALDGEDAIDLIVRGDGANRIRKAIQQSAEQQAG